MNHHFYMDIAIEEAKKALAIGEVPVGAIIIYDGKIIAQTHNLKEKNNDPTAHAEILAIKQAAQHIGNWRLDKCTLYVTLEPCPMCAGAIVQSRLKNLVYGIMDPKAGAVESVMNIVQNHKLNHRVNVIAGIRELEIKNIIQQFFKKLRK